MEQLKLNKQFLREHQHIQSKDTQSVNLIKRRMLGIVNMFIMQMVVGKNKLLIEIYIYNYLVKF